MHLFNQGFLDKYKTKRKIYKLKKELRHLGKSCSNSNDLYNDSATFFKNAKNDTLDTLRSLGDHFYSIRKKSPKTSGMTRALILGLGLLTLYSIKKHRCDC